MSKAELERQCPLVSIRIENDGIAGIRDGERVLFVKGEITRRTIDSFRAAYQKALAAGLLRKAKEQA